VRELVWLVIAALIGAAAVYAFVPNNPVTYREVIVPARVIIEREPDTVRTFIDRVRFVNVEPRQIAVAPGGAGEQVQEFCKPTIIAQTDTVEIGVAVDPMLLLRSVSYDRRWAWKKDRLFLAGPVNTGDLKALDYEVRGDWTARTVGDNVLVQYPRTSLVVDAWEGGTQIFALVKLGEFIYNQIAN
jgi:hypothetical protein